MKKPLTRPLATLSPQGRGKGCLALSFSHAETIGCQSSPSPLRGVLHRGAMGPVNRPSAVAAGKQHCTSAVLFERPSSAALRASTPSEFARTHRFACALVAEDGLYRSCR